MFSYWDFVGMTLEEIDWILCCMENNYNVGHYDDGIEYIEGIYDLRNIVDYLWEDDEYYYELELKF